MSNSTVLKPLNKKQVPRARNRDEFFLGSRVDTWPYKTESTSRRLWALQVSLLEFWIAYPWI